MISQCIGHALGVEGVAFEDVEDEAVRRAALRFRLIGAALPTIPTAAGEAVWVVNPCPRVTCSDFFGTHFRRYLPQFGLRDPRLFALLNRADAEPNLARHARLYEQASRLSMRLVPIAPYVHFKFGVALRKRVTGYVPDPAGPYNESFVTVGFASR
jgi:hypothetical protein